MTHYPPAPVPVIELGATYKVIDDSVCPPQWQTLGQGFATPKVAQAFITRYALEGIWMFDDCGYRKYIPKK